jgi:sugar O-acyltransferase (sialic acid O-acetyltransferase NeuD family)
MILVGAGGHAKELLGILYTQKNTSDIFLYDDVTKDLPSKLFNQFTILRNEVEARAQLQKDPQFMLGIGNPYFRYQLAEKFIGWGGKLTSVISPQALIGNFNVRLGEGLNIMPNAVITEEVSIGRGTLVHIHSSIHHDCTIGEYCEILPGSRVLGNVTIGDYSSIGSGAVILPKIKIGSKVIVGAGAIVTKNIADGLTVKGVPAK